MQSHLMFGIVISTFQIGSHFSISIYFVSVSVLFILLSLLDFVRYSSVVGADVVVVVVDVVVSKLTRTAVIYWLKFENVQNTIAPASAPAMHRHTLGDYHFVSRKYTLTHTHEAQTALFLVCAKKFNFVQNLCFCKCGLSYTIMTIYTDKIVLTQQLYLLGRACYGCDKAGKYIK